MYYDTSCTTSFKVRLFSTHVKMLGRKKRGERSDESSELLIPTLSYFYVVLEEYHLHSWLQSECRNWQLVLGDDLDCGPLRSPEREDFDFDFSRSNRHKIAENI